MKVLVLTSPPDTAGRPDTDDTFVQAREIAERLQELGHAVETMSYRGLQSLAFGGGTTPDLVVNLVEDLPEGPDQLWTVTARLDELGIACTGAGTDALRALARKPVMKAALRAAGFAVPLELDDAPPDAAFIVKSAVEHASIGLSDANVVTDAEAARAMIARRKAEFGGDWFAEAFIDGREFNVAILDGGTGPMVLPISEIQFTDHADGRPRIVGYAEKWEVGSRAFDTTPRTFGAREEPLFSELERLALAAWALFELGGYARIDFRVDRHGRPYILEINANPCLAADAGFCASAAQLGLSQTDVVDRIIEAARR